MEQFLYMVSEVVRDLMFDLRISTTDLRISTTSIRFSSMLNISNTALIIDFFNYVDGSWNYDAHFYYTFRGSRFPRVTR